PPIHPQLPVTRIEVSGCSGRGVNRRRRGPWDWSPIVDACTVPVCILNRAGLVRTPAEHVEFTAALPVGARLALTALGAESIPPGPTLCRELNYVLVDISVPTQRI